MIKVIKVFKNILGRYLLRKAYNRYNSLFNERFKDRYEKLIYNKNSTEEQLYDEIYLNLDQIYNNTMQDKVNRKKVYNKEVITLEGKLKYLEQTSNNQSIVFYVALLTLIGGLLSVVTNIYVALKINPIAYEGIIVGYFIAFFGIFLYIKLSDKSSFDRGTRVTFYSINLSIVRKIYQEKNDEDIKISSNEKVIIEDEAATTQDEKQKKGLLRNMSKQANGNWNVEINIPSIIGTVQSVYSVVKFARIIFRKKK